MELSVVVPVYNVAKYLRGCLDSVLAQQVDSLEVICVDDGSTDESAEILRTYADAGRIKVMSTPHVGAYAARARGLEVARGEFVHFMDADDELMPTAYVECLSLLKRESLDQVVFGADVFSDDEENARFRRLRKQYRRYYCLDDSICGKTMSGVELMDGMRRTGALFVGPPLRIVRRSLLTDNSYDFPDAQFHADNYFTVATLFYAKRVQAVHSCSCRRRLRPQSITTTVGNEAVHFKSAVNVLRALLRFRPLQAAADSQYAPLAHYIVNDMLASIVCRARACADDVVRKTLCEVGTEDGPFGLLLGSLVSERCLSCFSRWEFRARRLLRRLWQR